MPNPPPEHLASTSTDFGASARAPAQASKGFSAPSPTSPKGKMTRRPASNQQMNYLDPIPLLLPFSANRIANQIVPILQHTKTSLHLHPLIRTASDGALWVAEAAENLGSHGIWKAFSNHVQLVTVVLITSVSENTGSVTVETQLAQLTKALDDMRNILTELGKKPPVVFQDLPHLIYSFNNRIEGVLRACEVDTSREALEKIVRIIDNRESLLRNLYRIKAKAGTQVATSAPAKLREKSPKTARATNRTAERDRTPHRRHETSLVGDIPRETEQRPVQPPSGSTRDTRLVLRDNTSSVNDARNTRVDNIGRAVVSVGESFRRGIKQVEQGVGDVQEKLIEMERDHMNASQKDYERATLSLLQHVNGASWDSSRACDPGTRADILDEIMKILTAPADRSSALRIVLLTGVVGCGKTTIAHSVAKNCAEDECPMLGSSFFFSCEVDERRRPDKLFSTISRDLCDHDLAFRKSICDAIDTERALASAPISRQFDGLILKPAMATSPRRTHPLTIVIDALDEAYNEDLLGVLGISAALVPSEFRFFITTRSEATIISRLRDLDHISLKEINIRDNINRQDVKVFANNRLTEIANHHQIENWLDDNLVTRFEHHAEGLFIWAATVFNHVDACPGPREELDDILNNRDLLDSHVTEKMNKLYANILSKCPWHNRHFPRRYQSYLGAVIALRRPLSVSSIEELLDDNYAHVAFRPLSSLLTGALFSDQPVQIAHSSLRDFVTHCNGGGKYADERFAISEVHHSQHLALRCIVALNKGLPALRANAAFIFNDERMPSNIPILMDDVHVAEHIWYACEHWIGHVQDVKSASDELREELAFFMGECLRIWVAVGAMKGRYFGIRNLYTWSKGQDATLLDQTAVSKLLFLLMLDFHIMGKFEEALEAALDCAALRRDLTQDQPSIPNPDLAATLYYLSVLYSEHGHREEALKAAQECVALYRGLARDRPRTFNRELALSLCRLSVDLYRLERTKEALEVVQQCVTLCRGLVRDQPSAFNPDLAFAIFHLPLHLSGHQEEVLEAVRTLNLDLVHTRSSTFNPGLASTFYQYSVQLSNRGCHKEAIKAAQVCVAIREGLARDRPDEFKADLARSLENLARCSSTLGLREDALDAREKAKRILAPL